MPASEGATLIVDEIPAILTGSAEGQPPGRVLHVRGLGCPFLFEGFGLIIAVSSYCDDFLLQVGSSPEMMPDPEFFRGCLREGYDELVAAS